MDLFDLTDHIRQNLVSADIPVRIRFLAGATFQDRLHRADHGLINRIVDMIKHPVKHAEVIAHLDDVIGADDVIRPIRQHRTGSEQLGRLLRGQRGALHVVRIVPHGDLRVVVQPMRHPFAALPHQPIHKSAHRRSNPSPARCSYSCWTRAQGSYGT